jgi:prepilin signal peptidase PulO-like enzyme (type II secretory pathway)
VAVAAVCALAVALARALTGDRVSATTRIAFGSYLALAFWLVWLLGPPMLA